MIARKPTIGNLINAFFDGSSAYYGMLSVMIAVITVVIAERGWFKKVWGCVGAILIFALIGGGLGSVLTWFLYGMDFGDGVSAPLAHRLYESGYGTVFFSQFTADLLADLLDKTIIVCFAALVLHVLPPAWSRRMRFVLWRQTPLSQEEQTRARHVRTRETSLRGRIIALLFIALLLVVGVTVSICFTLFPRATIDSHAYMAQGVAKVAAEAIDADRVEDYLTLGRGAPGYAEAEAQLTTIRESAGDIEGLNEVIASFADGSDESVAAIAGMAAASDEDLRAMVKNYQELQKAQSETADAIAEFKTNFTEQMDELQRELAEDIEAMNLSSEAAESGRSTIQGFIDAAEEEMPRVQAAYARLGYAAANAMRHASGGNLTGIQGHGWASNGYAIGTEYAEAGLALIGEQGPELVMLQGGEKILTAAETRELQEEYIEAMMFLPELYRQLRGYAIGTGYASAGPARVGEQGPEAIIGAQFTIPRIEAEEAIPDNNSRKGDGGYIVTFSPVHNINGDMNTEELEAVLREHDENLKEQLEELLEEIEDDRARCAYR